MWPKLTPKACSRFSSYNSTFIIGVLVGLSPCFPLVMAIAYSATLGSVVLSIAFFVFFWIGSSIYMWVLGGIAGAIGELAVAHARIDRIRRICGIALAIVGLPFVPWESELDQLINGCGKTMSIFLQGLKETGADPGELWRVEWIDVNEKAKTIAINHPVKRHNARIVEVSREFIDRLHLLPKKSERIFTMLLCSLYSNFNVQRKRVARDFNNPRLLKICFGTFRHWKATSEYHRRKDILYVKQLLGHKKLDSTMIYIDIEKAIYGEHQDDDFISRCTRSDVP